MVTVYVCVRVCVSLALSWLLNTGFSSTSIFKIFTLSPSVSATCQKVN